METRRMVLRFTRFLLLCILAQSALPAGIVLADTGPKPTMSFEFKLDLPAGPVTIASGTLFECDQPDCSDAAPLEELGPQGFTCESDRCYAAAYGFAPFHRLEIRFSDGKTRESNVFETAGFDSRYSVTVRPDDLLVDAQFSLGIFPRTGTVLIACLCAFVGLALLAGLSLFLMRRARTT